MWSARALSDAPARTAARHSQQNWCQADTQDGYQGARTQPDAGARTDGGSDG